MITFEQIRRTGKTVKQYELEEERQAVLIRLLYATEKVNYLKRKLKRIDNELETDEATPA